MQRDTCAPGRNSPFTMIELANPGQSPLPLLTPKGAVRGPTVALAQPLGSTDPAQRPHNERHSHGPTHFHTGAGVLRARDWSHHQCLVHTNVWLVPQTSGADRADHVHARIGMVSRVLHHQGRGSSERIAPVLPQCNGSSDFEDRSEAVTVEPRRGGEADAVLARSQLSSRRMNVVCPRSRASVTWRYVPEPLRGHALMHAPTYYRHDRIDGP